MNCRSISVLKRASLHSAVLWALSEEPPLLLWHYPAARAAVCQCLIWWRGFASQRERGPLLGQLILKRPFADPAPSMKPKYLRCHSWPPGEVAVHPREHGPFGKPALSLSRHAHDSCDVSSPECFKIIPKLSAASQLAIGIIYTDSIDGECGMWYVMLEQCFSSPPPKGTGFGS